MTETPAQRAIAASTTCLLVTLGCIVLLLPPLAAHTVDSALRLVAVGAVLVAAVALHWIFLGIVAHRTGRAAAPYVALSVLLFPIGSAMALILLGWSADAADVAPAPHRA